MFLGKYTIPENTRLFVYQWNIMTNEKYWPNADQFIPERFLTPDGQYVSTRPQAFIPFGVGRRVCLGEKLAIADLFLVFVRFIQLTADYDIKLDENDRILDIDTSNANLYMSHKYKISFHQKH